MAKIQYVLCPCLRHGRPQLLPEARARDEQTLEAVRCRALFGPQQRLSLHKGLHLRPAPRRLEMRLGVSLPASKWFVRSTLCSGDGWA